MPAQSFPHVSIRMLSRLTGLNRDYLIVRIGEASPAGERRGYPVYALSTVLPLLCRPAASVAGETDPDTLTPVDRRAWFDSETKRRALQVTDRELIPVADVEETVGRAFAAVAHALLSLPDNLERRAGLTPEQSTEAERAIYAAMDDLADTLSVFSDADLKGKPDA